MANKISIIKGNCLELMKTLDDESIDLIVTDPPYNLSKDYGNGTDSLTKDEYLDFSYNWLKEAKRLLKPTGTLYVFMGVRYISYIYSILDCDLSLVFNSWITWAYTQGIGKTKGFSPRHDDILMFTKSDEFTFNLDDIRIPQKYYRSVNNMRGANPGNVWEFSHIHYCQTSRQNHPTQKPEALFERMILASSNSGDMVLDPFCGSGTSMRVCQQTNRNGIGMEINPDYIKQINNRLALPFNGFDSIDERVTRIPNDLKDENIRKEYVNNHINWFLKNHPEAKNKFLQSVAEKYSPTLITKHILDN